MKNIIRKRRISHIKIFILLGIIFLLFLVINLTKEIVNRRQIKKEIQNLQMEVLDLEKENIELGEYIDRWQTGSGLEKEARLKLGLKKPDEKVIIITRNEESGDVNIIDDGLRLQSEEKKMPNYLKWWLYFSNKN